MRVEISKYIVVDSEICYGKPTFKGTRVMVWQVLDMLRIGYSEDKILKSFPSLSREHISAALEFASKVMERKYVEVLTR